MIIDEAAYLEHFGKKGMKWGVRKTRTPAERSARNRKIATIGGTAAVVAGASFAAYMVKKNGGKSVKSLPELDIEKINKALAKAFEEGRLFDKPGLGRANDAALPSIPGHLRKYYGY